MKKLLLQSSQYSLEKLASQVFCEKGVLDGCRAVKLTRFYIDQHLS